MSAVQVQVGDARWRFVTDDPVAAPCRWWGMVGARLVDETTGEPPRAAARLSVRPQSLRARFGTDGLIGVVGEPWRTFSPLLQASFPVRLDISVDGFLPLALDVAIPVDRRQLTAPANAGDAVLALDNAAGLAAGERLLLGPVDRAERVTVAAAGPGAGQVTLRAPLARTHGAGALAVPERFTPLALGDLMLHRAPVAIHGRTLRRTAGGLAAVPNATVRIVRTWREPPPASGGVAPDPWVPAAVQPPLVGDWPAGTGRATLQALPPDAMLPARTLAADAARGDRGVKLHDTTVLAAGNVLIIADDSPERVEFVAIASVPAAPPGTLSLEQPLAFDHAAGTRVERASPQAPGASSALSQAARVADPTLLLASLMGILTPAEAALSVGGAAPPPFAYHRIAPYAVASGGGGDYRLPPLSRVGQLTLRASAAGLTDVDVDVVPDYASGSMRVDLVFD
jgi:hypothetical protein